MLSKSDVKYIQSLSYKKYRDEEAVFTVEGVKMVLELISSFPERIVRIFATNLWIQEHRQIVKNLTDSKLRDFHGNSFLWNIYAPTDFEVYLYDNRGHADK
jgi:tRNA G18 (ribose-2'-O)-methylase SpoU